MVALCAAATVWAQAPEITPASTLDLARLLDLCADRLGLQIDYDPGVIKGSVTLRRTDSLSPAELWGITNQLLAQRGFTSVRSSNAPGFSVVKLSEAAPVARVEQLLPDNEFAAGFSTLVIRVRHRTAKDLTDSLRPLLTKGGGAISAAGDSVIVVSDLTPRLREIAPILDALDSESVPSVIEEIECKNATPESLVSTLTQLATKSELAGGDKLTGQVTLAPSGAGVILIAPPADAPAWRDLIARFDRREGVDTRNYVPRVFAAKDVGRLVEETARRGGAADDRFKVVVDDLTGTLVVTATPSQHSTIAALVERLDAAIGGPTPMRSYPVRNRPVAEMIDTLSKLIEAGVLRSGTAGGTDRDAVRAAAAQRTNRPFTSEPPAEFPRASSPPGPNGSVANTEGPGASVLRLTADEATNTLIAIGEPRLLSQLEALLPMLDVRQPQVMLEVILVSMTDSDAINFGVELQKIGSLGNATTRIASLFGLAADAAAGATGFTGVILNPGEFSVVVQALQRVNKGNSLSNPRVLVTNNQQASFASTLQQPFLRTDTNNNSSTTSSYGGSEDAGTTISVKPQIAQGDHLALTYKISLSSFVGTPAAAGLPPPKQQNSVDSVATIPDGHTVVVGGLDLVSDSTSASQIPWIGDVPLVGNLFKNQSVGANRTRFYVFIKATVMRSRGFEDLRYVSGLHGDRAGVDDGLPDVRARVIR